MSQRRPPLNDAELVRLETWVENRIRECGIEPERMLGKNKTRRRRYPATRKSYDIVRARESLIGTLRTIAYDPISRDWWEVNGPENDRGHRLSTPMIGWLLKVDHATVILAERRIPVREAQAVAKLVEERRAAS